MAPSAIRCDRVAEGVEIAGFEPASKQGINTLSTRLSWPSFSCNGKTQATNRCLICFSFACASQPTHAIPCISAPLTGSPKSYARVGCPFSFQPTDSAWSDVSGQYLVPTLSQPTVLRFRQRELHCCCQLLFYRHDLRASLQCSACLHTYSTCCQNQLSPYTTNSLLPVSRLLCSGS